MERYELWRPPIGKKPSAKKPAGKKPAGKKPSAKKPAGKKPTGKKPTGKTPAGKTPAGKTPTGKTPTGKKPTGKKPTGKTPTGKKPTGKKPTGKKPTGKTTASGRWSLGNYRRPLASPPKTKTIEHAQLLAVLEREWGCSIAEAKRDEEIDLDLVDVRDPSDALRYQLYLWPFGSGLAFAAGTTDVAAEIVHHGIAPATDDIDVAPIIAAITADAEALGLRESKPPARARRESAPRAAAGTFAQILATAEDLVARDPKPYYTEISRLFMTWLAPLYGTTKDPRPYPKRLPGDLSTEQRTMLEKFVDWDIMPPLGDYGLFDTAAQLARYFGRAASGPTDATIELAGRTVPIWWAVSSAASGHAPLKTVAAALRSLDAATRRAIVLEIARGEAYDLVRARHTKFKDQGIPSTPVRRKYTTTLFQLLVDLATELEDPRGVARELLDALPSYKFGGLVEPHPRTPRALVALLVLAKLGPLDASLDPVIADLGNYCRRDEIYVDKKLVTQILDAVPGERRTALLAAPYMDWLV